MKFSDLRLSIIPTKKWLLPINILWLSVVAFLIIMAIKDFGQLSAYIEIAFCFLILLGLNDSYMRIEQPYRVGPVASSEHQDEPIWGLWYDKNEEDDFAFADEPNWVLVYKNKNIHKVRDLCKEVMTARQDVQRYVGLDSHLRLSRISSLSRFS